MHKTIIIAGLVVALSAGAALAQNPAPTAPAQGQQGADRMGPGGRGGPGGPEMRGPGRRGFGMRGGPGMRGMRQPPTPEQVQQRNAALFARLDANRDGRVTFEEFRQDAERRRLERQRMMFQRFSGEQDSVTLDQLNARALQRLNERGRGRGERVSPAAPPAARPAR